MLGFAVSISLLNHVQFYCHSQPILVHRRRVGNMRVPSQMIQLFSRFVLYRQVCMEAKLYFGIAPDWKIFFYRLIDI